MPFVAGINIPESDFMTKIFPSVKNSQKNRILIIMLESNTFMPYEFSPEQDLLVPSLNGVWANFIKDGSRCHWIKKSRCVEFERKESPQSRRDIWRFKMRAKPEKKVSKQRPKSPITLVDCKRSLQSMTQTMCSSSLICCTLR
jgi:hypothetical protein